MMKPLFGLVFATCNLFTACCSIHAEAPSIPLKIGLITPLTGPRASIGEDARKGAQLAISILEQTGELPKGAIQLVIEDSQGDPAKGVAAYQKLILDGARFVLTQNSNVSLAIAPRVDRDQVLQLAITTTSERYSTPNDNTFRTNGPTKPEAELMARTLKERINRDGVLALVAMQDEYTSTLEKFFLQALEGNNQKIITETFLPQESDYRSIISRISVKKPLAVVFLGYQSQAGLFLKQFREMGSPIALILSNTPVNNLEFFEIAGQAAEGLLITYPIPNLEHQAAIEFRKRYLQDPNFFSANAYDGVVLANMALANCDYKMELDCIKKALYSIKQHDGLSGKKGFDDKFGDMQDSYVLMVANGGKFVPLQARVSHD